MKINKPTILLLMVSMMLVLKSCVLEDLDKDPRNQFTRFYGSGLAQEAVDMLIAEDGTVCILANEQTNVDSSAVVLIKVDESGNQLQTSKFFGNGFSTGKRIKSDNQGNVYILYATNYRQSNVRSTHLVSINPNGDNRWIYESDSVNYSQVANDFVVDEERGSLILVGYSAQTSDQRIVITEIGMETGAMIEKSESSPATSDSYEPTNIVKATINNQVTYIVAGNLVRSVQFLSPIRNLFITLFEENFQSFDSKEFGDENTNQLSDLIFSANEDIILASNTLIPNSSASFIQLQFVRKTFNELIERESDRKEFQFGLTDRTNKVNSLTEVPSGFMYLCALAETEIRPGAPENNRVDIFIHKVSLTGTPLWDSPLKIGGSGSDSIAKILVSGDFVYILATIDMQNQNKLITLSKVSF